MDDLYPQPSVLVAATDIDVLPELKGVVRDLYGEDPDWASILPGLIDDEVAADLANRNYARQFGDAPHERTCWPTRQLTNGVGNIQPVDAPPARGG